MDTLQQTLLPLLLSTQSHPIGFAKLKSRHPGKSVTTTTTTTTTNSSGISRDAAYELEQETLGDQELLLLSLWDKLRDLEVRLEVLKALAEMDKEGEGDDGKREGEGESEKELQEQLIEAIANLRFKEMTIEATLAGDPILGAIYPNKDTPRRQRSLLPLLSRRDQLSSTHAHLSTLLQQRQSQLTALQTQTISLSQHNQDLAAEILRLSKQREKEKEMQKTPEYRKAEEAYRVAKRKWDVIAGVTRAVVVESGVDWVRDEELRKVVVGDGE
ncbi:centromere protein H (CENP-H)-domain-containing protein [Pyronema omphalodes]|nr:centromere protein H (CENP-H)-domain-containing protein [Pyronema omphalodes]